MTLPNPPSQYDPSTEAERNRVLEQADMRNFKRQADVELVSGARLILRSANGARWKVTVDNSGTLSAVAL